MKNKDEFYQIILKCDYSRLIIFNRSIVLVRNCCYDDCKSKCKIHRARPLLSCLLQVEVNECRWENRC